MACSPGYPSECWQATGSDLGQIFPCSSSFFPFSLGLVFSGGSVVWGDGFSMDFLVISFEYGDGVKASFSRSSPSFSTSQKSRFLLHSPWRQEDRSRFSKIVSLTIGGKIAKTWNHRSHRRRHLGLDSWTRIRIKVNLVPFEHRQTTLC